MSPIEGWVANDSKAALHWSPKRVSPAVPVPRNPGACRSPAPELKCTDPAPPDRRS